MTAFRLLRKHILHHGIAANPPTPHSSSPRHTLHYFYSLSQTRRASEERIIPFFANLTAQNRGFRPLPSRGHACIQIGLHLGIITAYLRKAPLPTQAREETRFLKGQRHGRCPKFTGPEPAKRECPTAATALSLLFSKGKRSKYVLPKSPTRNHHEWTTRWTRLL